MDIETFKEYTGEVLDELPEEFFKELSGGVIVQEWAKPGDYALGDDLYILGEYTVGGHGRQVLLYYGSFEKLFPYLEGEALKARIRETVRHEFRHHMEFLAGIHNSKSLEAEDERQRLAYMRSHGKK